MTKNFKSKQFTNEKIQNDKLSKMECKLRCVRPKSSNNDVNLNGCERELENKMDEFIAMKHENDRWSLAHDIAEKNIMEIYNKLKKKVD